MKASALSNFRRIALIATLVFLGRSVNAENWIAFYGMNYDLHAIDADSLRHANGLLHYRARVMSNDASIVDMQVDCASRERAELPDARMHPTYDGTLGGEEVKTVCMLASTSVQEVAKLIERSPYVEHQIEPEFLKFEEIRQFCDGVMGSVGADNVRGAIEQIKRYIVGSPKQIKEMEDRLYSWNITTTQLGYAQGSEFVKRNEFSTTLVRLVYLAKYDRGATRWIFVFYQRPGGWALVAVGSDADLNAVLEK